MKKILIFTLVLTMVLLSACAKTEVLNENSKTESASLSTLTNSTSTLNNSTKTSTANSNNSKSTNENSKSNSTITNSSINNTSSKGSSVNSSSKSASNSTSKSSNTEATTLDVIKITTDSGKEVASKLVVEGGSFASISKSGSTDVSKLDIEIRGRGNTTWTFDKKPYRVKLSSKANPFTLGSGKEKVWNLLANRCDHADIRNQLGLTFAESLDNLDFVPNYKQVELYFNNTYRGTYLLTEAVQVSSTRVDIDEVEDYLIEITKNNNSSLDSSGVFFKDALGINYEIKSDNTDTATIKTFLDNAMTAIKSKNRTNVEKYIDIPSAVDAYIVEETLNNMDVGWDSFYFTKKAGTSEKLHFGPVWDFDVSMGNGNDASQYAEGFNACKPSTVAPGGENRQNDWFISLMQCDWFRQAVKTRWNGITTQLNKLKSNVHTFSNAQLTANKRNFELWDKVENGKLVKVNFENDNILAATTYEEQVDYVYNWLNTRISWLNTQFNSQSYLDGNLPSHSDL